MPRKKRGNLMTDLEWIDKHINLHKDLVKSLLIPSEVVYNVNYWTPLKLISIGYFTTMYTNIIKNNFQRWLYCGIFSGCGLNCINQKDYFPGSPFFVINSSINNPFHKMYFIDSNKKRISALSQRLEYVSKNIKDFFFLGSTNDSRCHYVTCEKTYENFCKDTDFFTMLEEKHVRTHALVVIDPEGFEMGWNSLSKFFQYPCDIIFNFMTTEVGRTWGKAKRGRKFAITNMDFLFGDSSWNLASTREELLNIFIKKIEKQNRIVKTIRVKSSKKYFYYDLLVIVRKTRGGNPWLFAVDRLKNRVERTGSGMVKASIDYIEGRIVRIGDFFSN